MVEKQGTMILLERVYTKYYQLEINTSLIKLDFYQSDKKVNNYKPGVIHIFLIRTLPLNIFNVYNYLWHHYSEYVKTRVC